MLKKTIMFAALASTMLPFSAHALIVKNLSPEAQTFTVEQMRQQMPVTLQPNEVYRYYGPPVLLISPMGTPMRTQLYEEYVIWPDGRMHIQKRPSGRRNNGS